MADLSVKVCGVEFNNPLIAASGTFGFGMEYSELYPIENALAVFHARVHTYPP